MGTLRVLPIEKLPEVGGPGHIVTPCVREKRFQGDGTKQEDLDEFVYRSGSYAERFRRKIHWVQQNAGDIAAAMGFGAVQKIGAVMLTLYPGIARAFIRDFPCVSLAEFMLDYETKSSWPYPLD